ncbi:Hypothetical predicted protein [Olea europaea subsp. europaea]|uniref:Uncharacterized protein n=1 Tax=Olea europaea subsp. europaea TaxID=158383 RepID=A0A8S0QI40_OLEEU|nr:Hypothetical predicted protein [Olea europaea subsp. europaea]
MDFEYLVPKNARLRAHISQRSNLRYVKTVLEHFNERQRTDFCNSCLGFLSEVCSAIGSSIPMASELDVYHSRNTGRMMHFSRTLRYSIAFHAYDLHVPLLVTFSVTLIYFMLQLHVSATLRPTEVELGQPCVSTLLPFEDRTVPVLDEVTRDIIPARLHPDPLPSGENVGNSRGKCTIVSSGGGSEDNNESGDSEDEGAREETGGDKSGDSNGEALDEGDSEDDHTRTPQTRTYSSPPMHRLTSPIHEPSTSHIRQGQTSGASLTRDEVEELLLDQRTLIEIRLRTVKLEIMQHVTDEFVKVRDFISTLILPAPSRSTPPTAQAAKGPTVLATSMHDGNGGDTDPVPECADPQVHGRGFSPLPVDHDEDMDNEMQERNGGDGMESEPALNGDDDDVAFDGSGKREDDGVASPTGIAKVDGGRGMDFEPEKNSQDDEVSSGGSGNLLDKGVVSASGVAEVDGKYIVVENS